MDTSDLGRSVDKFNISAERLMVGMILAGMLIGGAIALVAPAETEIGAYVKLAVLLIFVFAASDWPVAGVPDSVAHFGEERRLERDKNPWKS